MIKKGLSIVILLVFLISMLSVNASFSSPFNPKKECMYQNLRPEYKNNLTKYVDVMNVPDCKYTHDEIACLKCVEDKIKEHDEEEKNNERKGIIFASLWVIFLIGSYGLMIYGIVGFAKKKRSLLFVILSTIISTIIIVILVLIMLFFGFVRT